VQYRGWKRLRGIGPAGEAVDGQLDVALMLAGVLKILSAYFRGKLGCERQWGVISKYCSRTDTAV
jgi:hypothetical protein